MKRLIYIPFLLCFCLLARAEVRMDVSCGDWVTIEAHPFVDYVFVQWSDGNTDSVRAVQVNEDAVFTAYFAAKCEEYANWPVIEVQDGQFSIDVLAINAMGYYISPINVTWYKVVGDPDDMHAIFPLDDQVVVEGSYFITLENNEQSYGIYYAVVDVSNAQGMLCDGLMRSVLVSYAGSGPSTSITDTHANDLLPQKIIFHDKIYILRGDKVYTPTGQKVK